MDGGVQVEFENNTKNSVNNKSRQLEKTILDNFSSLVKPQEGIRVKSGVNLLKYLSNNSVEKENETNYALGRIIRGLGSSSVHARTGFYSALVGLINIKDITVDVIFNFLEKELHKSGSNSKGENADIAGGQILVCGAVIRSRLWTTVSMEEKLKVISLLTKASKERSYLGLLAHSFLVGGFEKLNEIQIKKLFPVIEQEIGKPLNEYNLDTIFLLLKVRNVFPNLVNCKFFNKNFGTNDIICEENLKKLCDILLTNQKLSSLRHPAYETFAKQIAESEVLKDCLTHLDGHLERPNRNKHLLVIKIYTYILQTIVKTSKIPFVLTNNFIQQSLNYFKSFKGKDKDLEFQKNIHNFFKVLLEALKKEQVKSKTKILVLRKLLFYPGTFIFEKITKSKIVQQITACLDNNGVKNLADLYKGVISGTEKIDSQNGQNENWVNNDKLYAAHLLIKLLNHSTVKEENNWKVSQLSFLMDLGLFKMDGALNIGCELAASLKTAFFRALDLKLSKLEDLLYVLSQLVHHLDSKINAENLGTLRNPISVEEYAVWQKTIQHITKIEGKKKKGGLKIVFLTLFVNMGLQLFNEGKLAIDALDELFICYERSRKGRNNSVTSDDGEVTVNKQSDGPMWIEVVTDLFLNLLSHNSHHLRRIINCVFPHLCQYMTPEAIQHILQVIDPRNEENPLSNMNEGSDEESNVDEVEIGEEESEDDEMEESEDNTDAEEDETVNDKLRLALHQALSKNGGYQSDEESLDLDQMDENEGRDLDEALSVAFKQYRPNKGKSKKQSKDDEALTHFRIRVLDLIEIYIDSNPAMALALEIMLPLLQGVEFSIRTEHQKPLHDRLKACLKKLTSLKKFSDLDGIDQNSLPDLLVSLLEKGTKTSWIIQDMGVQIADCCVFVVKCSDILTGLESTPKKTRRLLKNSMLEIIVKELDSYFHTRDSLTPFVLFKNLMTLTWKGILHLAPLLLEFVFKEDIKPFKKNQVVELLKLFYLNQRYLSTNPTKIKNRLQESHTEFFNNIVALFGHLCKDYNQKIIKEKFICGIFNLLTVMKTCCLNLDNVNWNEIGNIVKEYRSYVTFSKDAKTAFSKLCGCFGISNSVEMKPKVKTLNGVLDKTENGTEIANKKKQKKIKNKEKLKLKKETKALRLKTLSEGFAELDFTMAANVSVEEIDNLTEKSSEVVNKSNGENLDDSTVKTKNKKKRKNNIAVKESIIEYGSPNKKSKTYS